MPEDEGCLAQILHFERGGESGLEALEWAELVGGEEEIIHV